MKTNPHMKTKDGLVWVTDLLFELEFGRASDFNKIKHGTLIAIYMICTVYFQLLKVHGLAGNTTSLNEDNYSKASHNDQSKSHHNRAQCIEYYII